MNALCFAFHALDALVVAPLNVGPHLRVVAECLVATLLCAYDCLQSCMSFNVLSKLRLVNKEAAALSPLTDDNSFGDIGLPLQMLLYP